MNSSHLSARNSPKNIDRDDGLKDRIFEEGPLSVDFILDHTVGAQREQFEKIFAAHEKHTLPRERISLGEIPGGHVVIHQRFASYTSIQNLILRFNQVGVPVRLEFPKKEDTAA